MQKMTLRIRGEVQGVFFRERTEEEAKNLGLVGFVRNSKDGSVEVVAEGDGTALQSLYDFCEAGPKLAMVDSIDDKWETISKSSFSDFRIVY